MREQNTMLSVKLVHFTAGTSTTIHDSENEESDPDREQNNAD